MPKRRRRYSRRHGLVGAAAHRRRLSVVAILVVIVVGGFFAVVAFQVGPAERIYERNIDSSFATLVTPIAVESNGTSSELDLMVGGGDSKLANSSLMATLGSMDQDAESAVSDFEALTPPANLETAATSCLSALQGRARALGAFSSAVATLVQGQSVDPSGTGQSTASGQGQSASTAGISRAETSIENLGSALSVTDNSWARCRQDLLEAPGRGANMIPASSWVGGLDVWRQASVSSFIRALAASAPHVAPPPLAIVTVAGDPPALVTVKGADVLPDTSLYSLHVVVADVADTEEHDVAVTVSLRPIGSLGTAVSRSAEASIGPDQSVSFHPAALPVTPGATYALEVAVSGSGQTRAATLSYRITIASSSGIPTS